MSNLLREVLDCHRELECRRAAEAAGLHDSAEVPELVEFHR